MRYRTLTALFLITALSFGNTSLVVKAQSNNPVIIDADTGNEVDDLYAIVRALLANDLPITALNATQWQPSHWAVPHSMENSHRLNQVLLGYFNRDIKTRRGGVDRMFDWGDRAQHSAAAYEIIKQAQAVPDGQQITIIALGALTNVASAIFIEPDISPKLKLYWLGTTYDFNTGVLGKTCFNCVMDIQALDIMLQSEVEMHVMPSNVAINMELRYDETVAALDGKHPLGDFLVERWFQHLDGSRKARIIWDLALIEAFLHPEWAEEVTVTTSRDSGNRAISFYKSIEAEKMKNDFFAEMKKFFSKENRD